MKRIAIAIFVILLMGAGSVYAMRAKKPPTFTDLEDTNQLTELNQVLEDSWQIQNGRYTLENLVTNPQDTRKGVKGDLVYATFGSNDHLCVNTSFPAGFDWTCINIGTLSTCPGGADGMVQFNDNGNCGGDAEFTWDKNANVLIVKGKAGFGEDITTPTAGFEIDPTNVTGLTVNYSEFLSDNQVLWLDSGTTVGSQLQNQFLAPTINGVSGGATETVTNAATVYIDAPPSGSNITITNKSDILFGPSASNAHIIRTQDQTTSNTDGSDINILLADGNGTSFGGDFEVYSGNSGGTGRGGIVNLTAGNGGSTSGDGGGIQFIAGNGTSTSGDADGGAITLTAGDATGTNVGGDIFLQPGSGSGGSIGGGAYVQQKASLTGLSAENTLFNVTRSARTLGIADGTTVTNQRYSYFEAPVINGVAGGGTETVTNAATVYIDTAPSGSNITFTNGPYALWVDAGRTRLDGTLEVGSNAEVTGTVVTWNTITSSRTTDLGWSVVTGANTACNTTCTSACVFGQDTDTANGPIVGCTDATADRCTCAGNN